MTADRLVLLGRVAKTHGIRGQLSIAGDADSSETLTKLRTVLLKGPGGELQSFQVASISGHGRRYLVKLAGIDHIDQAQQLVGHEVCVRREELPPLPDDEYYWFDLIGLRAVTVDGRELGSVAEIFATGSNDVYVIRGAGREFLIPAIAHVVVAIDPTAGTMTIDPLEGLLDL